MLFCILCNAWLSELLLPSYQLKAVWAFCSGNNIVSTLQQHWELPLTGYSPFFQNILCKPRRRLGGEMPMWKWITMKYSCENGNRMQELQLTDHNWPFIRNIQTYKEIIWPQKSLNSSYGNNSRDWRQPPAAVLEANKELKIYTKYSR